MKYKLVLLVVTDMDFEVRTLVTSSSISELFSCLYVLTGWSFNIWMVEELSQVGMVAEGESFSSLLLHSAKWTLRSCFDKQVDPQM